MAYVRKCSDEELSRIRSENARKGTETRRKNGTLRGGRKRSLEKPRTVSKVIAVDEDDYLLLQKYAFDQKTTMIAMFHRVMEEYKYSVACRDDDEFTPSAAASTTQNHLPKDPEERLAVINKVRISCGFPPLTKLPPEPNP